MDSEARERQEQARKAMFQEWKDNEATQAFFKMLLNFAESEKQDQSDWAWSIGDKLTEPGNWAAYQAGQARYHFVQWLKDADYEDLTRNDG